MTQVSSCFHSSDNCQTPHWNALTERLANKIVGGTINFRSDKKLYGRYWGSFRYIPHLHFEVCYYQAVEYCIKVNDCLTACWLDLRRRLMLQTEPVVVTGGIGVLRARCRRRGVQSCPRVPAISREQHALVCQRGRAVGRAAVSSAGKREK